MIWDIQKVLNWTQDYFQKLNLPSSRLDAELIISFVLNMKKIELYTQFDKILNKDELAKIKELIQRRAKKEPIAYIVGYKYFYTDKFLVTSDVLIPRPETELIVESITKLYETKKVFSLLDLGTGSGAIAISLQKLYPHSQITASDISEDALNIAKKNEARLLNEKKISFIASDMFKNITGQFDVIVSNPPYIPQNVFETLDDDVRLYEPEVALVGGDDGLSFYTTFFKTVEPYLKPTGHIFLEIGIDIIDSIQKIIPDIFDFSFLLDYNQIQRVIHITRK